MRFRPIRPLRPRRETEIKVRIEQRDKVEALLKRLGATAHGRIFEHNTLYDTPNGDFRRAGCLLRVREEASAPAAGARARQGPVVLTWKAPLAAASPRYKEKLEQEITTRKRRDWRRALKVIGLRPTFQYEKYRTSFRLGGLHLDLDETPVGNFLEIEGRPNEIERAARTLGFSVEDYNRRTYWDLYAAHCERLGRTPRNMLF